MKTMPKRRLLLCLSAIVTLGALLQGCATPVVINPKLSRQFFDPKATQFPVFDQQRLLLTSAYSQQHYGRSSSSLTDPRMIVVHYTDIGTLQGSLEFFQPDRLDRRLRKDIARGGDVNVSAHYVVDRNGDLYQLAPEDVICRHTIGFNYTAIGIENVAANANDLTDLQARANAALISRIKSRHPTIHYLIGHYEYRDSTLPHYRLFVEKDQSYRLTEKVDPGPAFMAKVRRLLREVYGITLSE